MNELFLNTLIIGLAIAAVIFTSAAAYAVIVFTVDRIKWRHAKPLSIRVKSAHTERQYFTQAYCLRNDVMYLRIRDDEGNISWWPVERFQGAYFIAASVEPEWAKVHMLTLLLANKNASAVTIKKFTEGAK